jgi:hypothetical protein
LWISITASGHPALRTFTSEIGLSRCGGGSAMSWSIFSQGRRISCFGDGPLAGKIKAFVAKLFATFKDDPARHKASTMHLAS